MFLTGMARTSAKISEICGKNKKESPEDYAEKRRKINGRKLY